MARVKQAVRKATIGRRMSSMAAKAHRTQRPLLPSSPARETDRENESVIDESQRNIRDEFEAALEDNDANFDAAFSSSNTYSDAPNPGLNLSGIGPIGLPLSPRDAEIIKSWSTQAPFGIGERTVVDTTVRDTWEMDAKSVNFTNPKWKPFVSQVTGEVCQTLGVDIQASKPKAQFYKLLLYETGSHFLPHVDTEKVDGMFATIVIVLPSQFTGGAAHLSHSGLSAIYDCSAQSHFGTTVLSWYTDVMHEIKPVTSGYRLALSYNLIHTTPALRPAPSVNSDFVEKLTQILLAWKNDESMGSPDKIIYLLDHKYSESNLKASALKGVDAHKVAILDSLAKSHDFNLGLANAHCYLSGCADDNGGWHRRSHWGYSDSSDASDRQEDVGFEDIESREMKIQHFVNLDGSLITEELEYDEETETIPADLTEEVESGKHDRQEYEGYLGNGAGSLERWYRRTVLVIWPRCNDYAILYQGDAGFARACDELDDSVSSKTTPEQSKLMAFIESKHVLDPNRAAETLCRAAYVLEDLKIWEKAIAMCSPTLGLATISEELVLEAIENFGFEAVKPSLEIMLKNDTHNTSRLQFLISLTGEPWDPLVTDEEQVQELHRRVEPWAVAQISNVLKTLKKPTIQECPILLETVRDYGEAHFLKDNLLPQLLAVAEEDILQEFASKVFYDKQSTEIEDKDHIVLTLLTAAISKTKFVPTPQPADSWRYPVTKIDYLANAKKYIMLCFELQCPALAKTVIKRVIKASELSPADAQKFGKNVMLPLATYLTERTRSHGSITYIETLRATAAKLSLDWLEKHPHHFGKAVVSELLRLCVVEGDPTVFIQRVVPRLEAMRLSVHAIRDFVDEVWTQRKRFRVPDGYTGRTVRSVIAAFAKKYVQSYSPNSVTSIMATLEWCSSIRLPTLIPIVVEQITRKSKLNVTYINGVLVPLLPGLRKWGGEHDLLDSLTPCFRNTVAAWIDQALPPMPQPDPALASQIKDLAKWTCACEPCSAAKDFLGKKVGASTSLQRIGAQSRRHLEQQLTSYARGIATFSTIFSSPQGLTVTKSKALEIFVTWKVERSKGLAMLRSISSDDDELKRLLSTEYNRAMTALKGGSTTLAPSTSSATPAGPSASSSMHVQKGNVSDQPPAKKRKTLNTAVRSHVNTDRVIDLT